MTISPSSLPNEGDEMNRPEKLIGKTFGGRYTVVSVVGIGGMSVVFGAYDTENKCTVALKLLDESSCESDAARAEAEERFKNEINAMARLSHPNIVNILDVSKPGEPLYFVMEYIEANTLKHKIDENGALTPEETLYYSEQILRALIHAHSKGIVHCDIKPQNIMLLPDGSLKLADFGIARIVDSKNNRESDMAVGTVYYISPEQASGRKIGPGSDIYSLGVMMYEMATGRLPFSASDTSAVSRMHMEAKPLRPRVIDPDIPRGLEQIILHAIEKTPFMRFQNASAMLDAVITLENNPYTVFEFNREADDRRSEQTNGETETNGISGWIFALLGIGAAFLVVLAVTLIILAVKGVIFSGTLLPASLPYCLWTS